VWYFEICHDAGWDVNPTSRESGEVLPCASGSDASRGERGVNASAAKDASGVQHRVSDDNIHEVRLRMYNFI
jgi:hypothetical protein